MTPTEAERIAAILDELATTVHNLSPGDIGSIDRVLVPINKAAAAIAEVVRDASEYQVGVTLLNEKLGFWGVSIAKDGRSVYGEVYRTEQEARDDVPRVLAKVKQLVALRKPDGGEGQTDV